MAHTQLRSRPTYLRLEITLWRRNDALVAWTWLRSRGGCDVSVTPAERCDSQIGTSGPAARAAYIAAGFRPWKREHTYRRSIQSV